MNRKLTFSDYDPLVHQALLALETAFLTGNELLRDRIIAALWGQKRKVPA